MRALLCLTLALCGALASAIAADPRGEALFNGRDLTGWEGDPQVWSVRDGAICGESTWSHPVLRNTFLTWRGGEVRNFELRFAVRLSGGNSGVQYRSTQFPGYVVAGYQAEITDTPAHVGFLYEERGRKFLALPGERVWLAPNGERRLQGWLFSPAEFMRQRPFRAGEWNQYRIVARGPRLAHFVNGMQTVAVIDSDPRKSASAGILALQVHAGLPMKVEFKDLFLRTLP